MKELETVLVAFRDITQCDAAVWSAPEGNLNALVPLARSSARLVQPEKVPVGTDASPMRSGDGKTLIAQVPGIKRTWLAVAPCSPGTESAEKHLRLLLPFVVQVLRGAQEVDHAALELAERYEEINLLYTIGEILGRTVTLEEAATTILTEISETVGARHASILVHDARTNTLQAVAALGVPKSEIPPISADDQSSVSARVFRTQHPLIVVGKGVTFGKESPYGRGEMLSVPIMWTTPSGGMPLGVVNLADRRSRQPFTAGDQKLVTAIATQIGTAIQNARLVSASLD